MTQGGDPHPQKQQATSKVKCHWSLLAKSAGGLSNLGSGTSIQGYSRVSLDGQVIAIVALSSEDSKESLRAGGCCNSQNILDLLLSFQAGQEVSTGYGMISIQQKGLQHLDDSVEKTFRRPADAPFSVAVGGRTFGSSL